MAKPPYGTLISSNALTTNMRCAYLLNGTPYVNSVGGGESLNVVGTGLSYDSGTQSLQFTGSGLLQIPMVAEFNAIADATLLIGYKTTQTQVPLWDMGQPNIGDYIPYNDGNTYTGSLVNGGFGRYSFPTPGGITWSAFNQVGVTGHGGGNLLFYVNGVLKNTHVATATLSCGASGHIGHNSDGLFFNGYVQFFYAWKNRVLTATDLASIATDPYATVFSGGAGRSQVFVLD